MNAAKAGWSVLLVALALVLGACGGSDDDDGGGAAGGQGGTPASSQKDPAEGLTIGIVGGGQPLDPSTLGMGNISVWASGNVYEYLVDREAGTDELTDGLATSWETSEDGRTIDLELREGVKFHSGDPFTAEDVAFTWDRLVKSEQAARYSSVIDEMEVVDDSTVRIRLKSPDVGFIAGGGFPVQSKAYFDKVGEKKFASTPVGTGPYEVTDVKGGESITMEPFADYWGDKGEIRRVVWRFLNDESTRVNSLLSGDADMIAQVPPALVQRVNDNPQFGMVKQDPGGYSVWMQSQFLDESNPMADPRVRRAVALAIDEQALVKDVLSGAAAHYPGLAPKDIGYDPNLKPYGYDPEAAKRLLAEAGHPDGFKMDLVYMTGVVGGMEDTAATTVLYLRQVGIDAKAVPMEAAQFRDFTAKSSGDPEQDYNALFVGTIAGMVEPTLGLMTHFSDNARYARYFNKEADALLEKASATLDEQERAKLLQQAMRTIHEDVGYVPLWTNINHYAMRKGLEFTPTRGNYEQFQLDDIELPAAA